MTQATMFDDDLEEQPYIPYVKSLIKSAMQKRVRRGEVEQALRLSKSHIYLDAHDFARRIMVVVPEEVTLHPLLVKMPQIITRLQKRGQVATDEDKSIMLTLVRDAALANRRDFYLHNPLDKPYEPGQFEWLTGEPLALVNAVKFRRTIGGMRSDIGMFASLEKIWVNRFSNEGQTDWSYFYTTLDEPMVQWQDIDYAVDEDIPYYAMDFHCFRPVAKLLLNRKGQPTELKQYVDQHFRDVEVKPRFGDSREEEIVKKTMWLYEAGFNTKIDLSRDRQVDWFLDNTGPEPVEHREKFTALNEMMREPWTNLTKWYVKKQHEGKTEKDAFNDKA